MFLALYTKNNNVILALCIFVCQVISFLSVVSHVNKFMRNLKVNGNKVFLFFFILTDIWKEKDKKKNKKVREEIWKLLNIRHGTLSSLI